MPAIFSKRLTRDGHVRSFRASHRPAGGWETAAWKDQDAAETQRHTDWHRVERELCRFTREITELRRQGWFEADASDGARPRNH